MKNAEITAADPPPQEAELGITPIDYSIAHSEKEKLYVEMLYTIANTVRVFWYLLRRFILFRVEVRLGGCVERLIMFRERIEGRKSLLKWILFDSRE